MKRFYLLVAAALMAGSVFVACSKNDKKSAVDEAVELAKKRCACERESDGSDAAIQECSALYANLGYDAIDANSIDAIAAYGDTYFACSPLNGN